VVCRPQSPKGLVRAGSGAECEARWAGGASGTVLPESAGARTERKLGGECSQVLHGLSVLAFDERQTKRVSLFW